MAGMVAHSSGRDGPAFAMPDGACDAHFHVIDAARYPAMTVAEYQRLERRLGVSRAVLVQAKAHGTDHSVLVDAIATLGHADARGIAVLTPDVPDAELQRLHRAGVRGLRFSLWNPADQVVHVDMLEPMARRIAPLGWHVQLHLTGAQIVAQAALLQRLPCPTVFDHMGRLDPVTGPQDPAFAVIHDLAAQRRAFVKLSGSSLNRSRGRQDDAEALRIARALVAQMPDRLVWGSDWPHIIETHKPDDAAMLNDLAAVMGDAATRRLILTETPARLYGF